MLVVHGEFLSLVDKSEGPGQKTKAPSSAGRSVGAACTAAAGTLPAPGWLIWGTKTSGAPAGAPNGEAGAWMTAADKATGAAAATGGTIGTAVVAGAIAGCVEAPTGTTRIEMRDAAVVDCTAATDSDRAPAGAGIDAGAAAMGGALAGRRRIAAGGAAGACAKVTPRLIES